MCYFEITLNIHPPFVVSVAVLIINIHKSRAVTLRRERQRGRQDNNSFNRQKNNLARAAHFFVHFFAVLQDYDVKMPSFAFYGERKQATTKFYLSL